MSRSLSLCTGAKTHPLGLSLCLAPTSVSLERCFRLICLLGRNGLFEKPFPQSEIRGPAPIPIQQIKRSRWWTSQIGSTDRLHSKTSTRASRSKWVWGILNYLLRSLIAKRSYSSLLFRNLSSSCICHFALPVIWEVIGASCSQVAFPGTLPVPCFLALSSATPYGADCLFPLHVIAFEKAHFLQWELMMMIELCLFAFRYY